MLIIFICIILFYNSVTCLRLLDLYKSVSRLHRKYYKPVSYTLYKTPSLAISSAPSTPRVSNPLDIPAPPISNPIPISPSHLRFVSPVTSDTTNIEEYFQPIRVILEKQRRSNITKTLGPIEPDSDDNDDTIDKILYELGCPLKNSRYNGCININIII